MDEKFFGLENVEAEVTDKDICFTASDASSKDASISDWSEPAIWAAT